MDFLMNFVIITLFIFPFIAFIHESGHAFFIKVFGGKISEFAIGIGDVLWQKNMFVINKAYFAGGRVVTATEDLFSKSQKVFILLGGVIFNLISALALDLYTGYDFFVFRNYLDSFIFVSYLNVFINLIPFTTINGKSDGKKLVELI
ncbi:site-2 protease family protein [Jeotgalibacillus sp. ET6]|uniref:site-2 protease family protein n=1 Tax=Jeotgalibacillus sp. ET6 TaxID=3037260 RepID=UPI002418707B|nr:site-2 protease family protein [Jeotgalibacillus sp. ET6]MDG5473548.1 site-2 protease family protein [Jeotgalibacillus sp. ET6]